METALPILAAVAGTVWLASVALTAGIGARVRARGDADAGVRYAAAHARIATFVSVPAALVALACGVAALQLREESLTSEWWIGTALGAWIVAFVGSTATRGPLLRRAVQVADEIGAAAEDVRWRIRQVTLVARGELLLLTVAAVVVALQPDAPL